MKRIDVNLSHVLAHPIISATASSERPADNNTRCSRHLIIEIMEIIALCYEKRRTYALLLRKWSRWRVFFL